MRLWHQDLISHLPTQQLVGQHRECCALRGMGWGRKHATVNYVFTHNPALLIAYHLIVIDEMVKRGYKPYVLWRMCNYRGRRLGMDEHFADAKQVNRYYKLSKAEKQNIFPEHNEAYLKECLENLQKKGVVL